MRGRAMGSALLCALVLSSVTGCLDGGGIDVVALAKARGENESPQSTGPTATDEAPSEHTEAPLEPTPSAPEEPPTSVDSGPTPAPEPPSSEAPTAKSKAKWLYTRGNRIYNGDGTVFRGRGANIHDTRSCDACAWTRPNVTEVKRRVDALVDDWNANFMRLVLESYAAGEGRTHYKGILEDDNYLADMVEVIDHIGKKNVHVLVSLWDDPSFSALGWPTEKTIPIWEKLAETFAHDPHVMFGLVNEPQRNFDGKQDGDVWHAMNETVAAIRAVEKRLGTEPHIITVQGTRAWGRNLGYYVDHPITAGGGINIVYESHAYLKAREFSEIWSAPAEKLPVIIGEFGPASLGGAESMTMEETKLLMQEAEVRDVPWLAWTFHMRCAPNLLVQTATGCGEGMPLEPTAWGKQVKTQLATPWGTR